MGAEGAVEIIFRKQVEESDDPAAQAAELIDNFRQIIDVYIAAGNDMIDDVIDPRETRATICRAPRDGRRQAGRAPVQALRRPAGRAPAVDAVVSDVAASAQRDPRLPSPPAVRRRAGDGAVPGRGMHARVARGRRSRHAGCAVLRGARRSRTPSSGSLIWAWAHRGEEMIAGQLDGTVAILRALKHRGVRRFALTNMEAETYPLRRRRFEFFGMFDGIVVSRSSGLQSLTGDLRALARPLRPASGNDADDRRRAG